MFHVFRTVTQAAQRIHGNSQPCLVASPLRQERLRLRRLPLPTWHRPASRRHQDGAKIEAEPVIVRLLSSKL